MPEQQPSQVAVEPLSEPDVGLGRVSPPRPSFETGWTGVALLGVSVALLWGLYALSLSALQSTKLVLLALPAWVLLGGWKPASRAARWAQLTIFALWVGLFVADAIVRAYLWQAYGSAPDSAKILTALSNTGPSETVEYVQHAKVRLLAWWVVAVAAWAVLVGAAPKALAAGGRCWPAGRRASGQRRLTLKGAAIALLLLLGLAAHASKPWRGMHPVLWWPAWATVLADTRTEWHDWEVRREAWLEAAQGSGVRWSGTAPHTVMLVITDSVNRDNLGLYGYGRNTTPQLAQQRQQLTVMRHAWSVAANTVMTMPSMLRLPPQDGDVEPSQLVAASGAQDLLALARAAGYEVHWISNHDDLAIQQRHGALAQWQDYPNHSPGRASKSLDEAVLPYVERTLARPAARKLLVVHLLGAHPHYRARYPEGWAKFGDNDALAEQMRQARRWPWIRHLRHEYDTSLHYHDQVLARLLLLTQQQVSRGSATWVMVSDHGQEVGHERNHAGHSASTVAGYRIPLVVWRNAEPWPEAVSQRPVRGDWLGMSLVSLLGLDWSGYDPRRDVFNPQYQWQPPTLPVPVPDFQN